MLRWFKNKFEACRRLNLQEKEAIAIMSDRFHDILGKAEHQARLQNIFKSWDNFNRRFTKDPTKTEINHFLRNGGYDDIRFLHGLIAEAYEIGDRSPKLEFIERMWLRGGEQDYQSNTSFLMTKFFHPKLGGISLRSLSVATSICAHELLHEWQNKILEKDTQDQQKNTLRDGMLIAAKHFVSAEKILGWFLVIPIATVSAVLINSALVFSGAQVPTILLWGETAIAAVSQKFLYGVAGLMGLGTLYCKAKGYSWRQSVYMAMSGIFLSQYQNNLLERQARYAQKLMVEQPGSPLRQCMNNLGFDVLRGNLRLAPAPLTRARSIHTADAVQLRLFSPAARRTFIYIPFVTAVPTNAQRAKNKQSSAALSAARKKRENQR